MILHVTLIGTLVGVLGTGLGGLLSLFLTKPRDKLLSFILGFSAGIMLTIVCFELLPEAFEMADVKIGIIGLVLGVVGIILVDDVITNKGRGNYQPGLIKMGILIGLGIALHNFPEGLAIGSGFMATRELGIGISIVIALHNIPEGISMATPMRAGGYSKLKAFLYSLAAGLPMGLGAFVGAVLGEISPIFIALCLSFAGGTMLYIVCGELIPGSNNLYIGRTSTWGLIVGFLIGLIIIF